MDVLQPSRMHRSSHWRRAELQPRQRRGVPLDRLSSGVARNLRRPIHAIGWPSSCAPPMRCRAACRPVVPRCQAFQSRSHTDSWVLARAPTCWQFRQKQLCRLFLLFGGAHRVRRSDHTTAAGAWAVAPDKRGVRRWRNPSLLATSRRPPALAQSSASTGSVQELPAELHGTGRSATMTEGITCRLNGLIRRRRRKKPGAPAAVEVVSCAANAFSSGSAAAQQSRTAIGRHTRRSQRSERACPCRLMTLGPAVTPPRAEIQPFFRCFRVVLRPGSPPRSWSSTPSSRRSLHGIYTVYNYEMIMYCQPASGKSMRLPAPAVPT